MKASISVSGTAEVLMAHMRHEGEGMSQFVARMIEENASARGLEVVTEVRQSSEAWWERDPCDCGTVMGLNGGYIPHEVGGHPDCTGDQ